MQNENKVVKEVTLLLFFLFSFLLCFYFFIMEKRKYVEKLKYRKIN